MLALVFVSIIKNASKCPYMCQTSLQRQNIIYSDAEENVPACSRFSFPREDDNF